MMGMTLGRFLAMFTKSLPVDTINKVSNNDMESCRAKHCDNLNKHAAPIANVLRLYTRL